MFRWLNYCIHWKLFHKEPVWKFVEGQDFKLVADLQGLKDNDPYPWSILYLNRVVKVHTLKLPQGLSDDGFAHVEISAEVIEGEEFSRFESQGFGELLVELVQRNLILKDK